METLRVESRAVWVSVVIVIALAVGAYMGWPRLTAYWANMNLKTIIKANSVSCLDPSIAEEGCKEKMIKGARGAGVELLTDDLQINANPNTRKVVVEVKYKAKLVYPLTETIFGTSKDQFVNYRYRLVTESKYTL